MVMGGIHDKLDMMLELIRWNSMPGDKYYNESIFYVTSNIDFWKELESNWEFYKNMRCGDMLVHLYQKFNH